jgi:uracil phosphoribosyltransferase
MSGLFAQSTTSKRSPDSQHQTWHPPDHRQISNTKVLISLPMVATGAAGCMAGEVAEEEAEAKDPILFHLLRKCRPRHKGLQVQ